MNNNERLTRAIGGIDDKYIIEAKPKAKKTRKRSIFKPLALVASLAIVVGLSLWLFIPYDTTPPTVSEYADSEYYSLIQKIAAYRYRPPRYKNNFEMLASGFKYGAGAPGDLNGADGSGGSSGATDIGMLGDSYFEVTDNQVEGVIEGDRIKRTDKYIYHLYETCLSVYSIEGENSTRVGYYDYNSNLLINYSRTTAHLMYLSQDCKTVTVIAAGTAFDHSGARIAVISLDVTDPGNITEKSNIIINGSYFSSRMANGHLLIMSEYYFGGVDYSNPETFVPYVEQDGVKMVLGSDDLVFPDKLTASACTVVTKLNAEDLSLVDSGAFYSYSNTFYVTSDTVYATRPHSQVDSTNGTTYTETLTEIYALKYSGDEMERVGSVTVSGTVLDQYSIDEYMGALRVVTTVNETVMTENWNPSDLTLNGDSSVGFRSSTSASLYVIDIQSLEIIASVERFAPEGESVTSARFEKNTAYVCTSIRLTDPVFFFDLSDYENITYVDTGKIDGFSTSLIEFGDYLVGIGTSSWNDLKVEVYIEDLQGVVSFDTYLREYTHYPNDYKCYFIDRTNGYIGIPVYNSLYGNEFLSYVLLKLNDGKLEVLVDRQIDGWYEDMVRGVVVDDYLYVMSRDLTVVKLNSD